ncbi:MAG: UbiA family prenyltransferase [Thermoplasmatota archaeon]
MGKISTYATLFRIPGLGGLAIPPVIAALTMGVFDIFQLILLFLIGAFSVIYGFILNDYVDMEVDKLSNELKERPLVSGKIHPSMVIWLCFSCIILTFLGFFILFFDKTITQYRFLSVLCIIVAWLLGSIYDQFGKKIVGSDFFVSLSVAFVFLFGAFAYGFPTLYTWIIFVLTFNQLLHMNAVEGGIKDADHDYLMGVKNIASKAGVKVIGKKLIIPTRFKVFSLGIRLFSIVLLFVPFIFYHENYVDWQIVLLTVTSAGVVFFTIRLLSLKTFDRKMIRKYISVLSFLRFSLVPLMLISVIGMLPSLILIIFPIVWYICFTPLTGAKLFQPRM